MRKRRAIRPGELLAIDPKAIQAGVDREAFFLLWANPMPLNERVGPSGEVAVVHIRGPLEHHEEPGCDSYDSIKDRVKAAFAGERDGDHDADDEEPMPPRAVALRIDSPGGVVSGLNETVKCLRRMSEECRIPLYAYVDEMACSAAYALASAASEIYLPPSAIAGSVGVISTMVDQVVADKAMGLRFVTLTSGARKADGHPHVAISDAAITAEQGRVDRLAQQFFRLVEVSRSMSVEKIKALQAAIYVGRTAVEAGLADGLMTWPEFVAQAAQSLPLARMGQSVSGSSVPSPTGGGSMLKLKALLEGKKKALKAATSKKRRAVLEGEIASLKATLAMLDAKTTHTIEHRERHVADDGDDDDVDDGSEDDDDKEDDDEEEEEAGGNETDRSDEEEEDEEEEAAKGEEEEEAAAGDVLRAAIAKLPKSQRASVKGALAALEAKAQANDAMNARLKKIERDTKMQRRTMLIASALKAQDITPAIAKRLRGQSLGEVESTLGNLKGSKIGLMTKSEDLARPPATQAEAIAAKCSDEEYKAFSAAATASGIPIEKFVEAHRAETAQLNGAAGAGSY